MYSQHHQRAGFRCDPLDSVSSVVDGELTRNRLNSDVACLTTFCMLCTAGHRMFRVGVALASRAYRLEACSEARLMGCARAAHDMILCVQVARGILSSYGSGRRSGLFWPYVVCACAYELAESKYTVHHVRPKRTLAATHISDRSTFQRPDL